MANIIRCKLPDGIHRFKPFKVSDYRDFLLIRNDMMSKSESEQIEMITELAEEYFPDFPKSWQQYIFLFVFTGSIGKTKIPIIFECPVCGKKHKRLFNISQDDLISPTISLNENVSLTFNFPDSIYSDPAKLVIENIKTVNYSGVDYRWEDLSSSTQEKIFELIDFETFDEIVKKLKPIHFEMVMKCCETNTIIYDDLTSIFKLLINPDEVFPFYEINHILSKNNYHWDAIMNMLPAERSIALSLIEKDSKK
ncbi:hypothetical protein ACX818_001255 [Acinetobacter baumannii]